MRYLLIILVPIVFISNTIYSQDNLEQKSVNYIIEDILNDEEDYPNIIKLKLKRYKYIEDTSRLFSYPCLEYKEVLHINVHGKHILKLKDRIKIQITGINLINQKKNKTEKTRIVLQFHQRQEVDSKILITLSLKKKKDWIEYFVFKYDKDGNSLGYCSSSSLL